MIRYTFRDDEPIRIKAAGKADPQVFGEALADIANKTQGELTPHAVLEAARAKKHPLHPHFEWDDALAAEAFRLDQARSIIRVVRVVDREAEDGTRRAFVSVATKDGTAYRPIGDVQKSADLQLALMRQADRDLEAWERRYRELTDICNIVSSARGALQKKMQQPEQRVAA